MGARANILMKYSDGNTVNIYSHWDGEGLRDKLAAALNKRKRWDDEMYLGRIIFCEVAKNDIEGERGYGLSPYVGEEEYATLNVDMVKRTVNGKPFQEFIAEAMGTKEN